MTAVHHNSNIDQDEKDFKVSKFDEAVCREPNSFSSEKDPFESPLCVPQDALDNLEWYNGFWGDFDSSLFNDFKFEIEQSSEGKFLDTHEEEKIKFEQSGEGKTQKDPFLDASNIQNNHESQSKNQKKSNDFKFKFDESNEGKFVDTDHEEEEEEEEEEEKIKFEQFAKGKTQKDQFLDVSNIQNNHESQSKNQKKLNDFKFELKQSSEGKFQEKIKLEQSSEGKTQKNPYLDASNIIQNNHESQSKNQKKAGFVKKRRTKTPREKNIFGGSWWDSGNDFEKLKENVDIINETGRRCSHCESKHTTQWRAGPLGRNTLCNACGLRFKSGRLLPEYRPAASPTFDESKYSNFHKRVLKKREYIIR